MSVVASESGITVSCPEVHEEASMTFSFQRTLRVPDDGNDYDLPPGLGQLLLRDNGASDDGSAKFAMPMWQSEACWINFNGRYPFLVTMSAGSINVVTGEAWSATPNFEAEDYLEVPSQPWLDGFNVESGKVRQFVAAPLGSGHTVEEQLSDDPARGGVQVAVYPMLASRWATRESFDMSADFMVGMAFASPPMGLGAGGSINQSIATPVEPHDAWDLEHGRHFTIDIVNSADWQELTGTEPTAIPLSAADYTRHGMPWFTWYDDLVAARNGSTKLSGVRTVAEIDSEIDTPILPENESFESPKPIAVK